MVEDLAAQTAKGYLDYGVLGLTILFLIAFLVFVIRYFRGELDREREAHQKTREAHIKAMEAGFGLTADIKDAVAAMKETGDQWIEFAKTVSRTGDRP